MFLEPNRIRILSFFSKTVTGLDSDLNISKRKVLAIELFWTEVKFYEATHDLKMVYENF